MQSSDDDDFRMRVALRSAKLSPSALLVARYIDKNRTAVIASSASQLASRIGISDATVVRSVQSFGYRGLSDLKHALASKLDSALSAAEGMRRTLSEAGEGPIAVIEDAMSAHADALSRLQSRECVVSVASAVSILGAAQRIVVFGIGPSGCLAAYMGLMLGRVGRRTRVLDVTGRALADALLDLQPKDAVFMMAYGAPYAEAKAVVSECLRLGLPLVLTTDAADGYLAQQADVVIIAPRGRSSRVALHAGTMVVLEATVLGLASIDHSRALRSLGRLSALRTLVAPDATAFASAKLRAKAAVGSPELFDDAAAMEPKT